MLERTFVSHSVGKPMKQKFEPSVIFQPITGRICSGYCRALLWLVDILIEIRNFYRAGYCEDCCTKVRLCAIKKFFAFINIQVWELSQKYTYILSKYSRFTTTLMLQSLPAKVHFSNFTTYFQGWKLVSGIVTHRHISNTYAKKAHVLHPAVKMSIQ